MIYGKLLSLSALYIRADDSDSDNSNDSEMIVKTIVNMIAVNGSEVCRYQVMGTGEFRQSGLMRFHEGSNTMATESRKRVLIPSVHRYSHKLSAHTMINNRQSVTRNNKQDYRKLSTQWQEA